MYEINKLLYGQSACTGFSHSFFVSEIERASAARSLARLISPTRANIPYARPAHEVISMYIDHDENRTANQIYLLDSN